MIIALLSIVILIVVIFYYFPQLYCLIAKYVYLLFNRYRPCSNVERNITYSLNYPNSELDVYYSQQPVSTIFYIHGGGYCFDDKKFREQFLMQYAQSNFDVVSINYALCPTQKYFDTKKQITEAFYFMEEKLLRNQNIIFMGDSAGAQMSAELLHSLQKNGKKNIVAFISMGGVLDLNYATKTNNIALNLIIDFMIRAYFENQGNIENANPYCFVDENFPPCFISDGNFQTFTNVAKRFCEKLDKLNIEYQCMFFDNKKVKLKHVFELNPNNEYAKQVFTQQIIFIDSLLRR